MNKKNHVCSVLFVIALALAGCGEKTSKAPPKKMVQDAVNASLPPFLSLDSIELEPISTGPEAVKVNFKAIVTPKEDLYQVDREVQGTPTVTLLKVVQSAGSKASLYGSVEALRTMDQWTLESPQIEVGLKQFGTPRGAFHAQSYVTGSNEANAALRQQAANATEIERQRKAAMEQREREQKALREQQEHERTARQEQEVREEKARKEREEKERIALEELRKKEMEQRKKEEEERQKEEAAARQKLILATVQGTRYIGTISSQDQRQRLRLVFTEQNNFLIRAEASNPDNPKQKQTFTGELIFNPQPEEDSTVAYSIAMSPIGGEDFSASSSDRFIWFYRYKDSTLKLLLTDTGLEGEGRSVSVFSLYTIRLQREQTPVTRPPAASAPGSSPASRPQRR